MSENGEFGSAEHDEMAELEDLKDERNVLKDALKDAILRLNTLNNADYFDEELAREVKELQLVIEPSLMKIKELDVRIQADMRKLKLRLDLVEEIEHSRAYAAKIQAALNRL